MVFKRIRMEADKAIEKLKASFGGRSFALLGQARGALDTAGARSAFKTFSGEVDIKNLNAQAIQQLAQASKEFDELGREGQSAVNSLLNQIREFKDEVTGEDVFGVVKAVQAGLASDSVSQSLIDLFKKSIGASIQDVEAKAKQQEEKLYIEGLRKFTAAQDRIIETARQSNEEFKNSVNTFRLSSDAVQKAVSEFVASANKPINLVLKGELSRIVEKQFEKSRQNKTGNLNR